MTAGTLLGCRMRGINVLPVGISIDMSPASSTCEEIIIAAAGPAVNLILCAASALFYSGISVIVMTFSLSVFFINILPIKTLDGGRILYSALTHNYGGAAAMTAVKTTTCVCLSVLWIMSVYILFYSSINFSLLLFCSYMFAYTIVKEG
jgi:Zn-dependent protease